VGYLGFTGGQILAGAKLAAGSIFAEVTTFNPLTFSLYVIAVVILLYTVLGGLKAVIYTDTIQWIVLLSGLLLVGFPFAYIKLGGWEAMIATLPASHFSFSNISIITLVNWACTIVPIWFIAMTLYQRVYASPNVKEARKAFFIAGIFEYPFMAFAGVLFGMLARIAFPGSEPEMALPLMLTHVLPVGMSGFLLASYFSAVMSTADSCLIASSGNFTNDILSLFIKKKVSDKFLIRLSQVVTLVVGVLALLLAGTFQSVLEIVLQAYGFMVSGLLVPTLAAYFTKKPDALAATVSMLGGGGFTLTSILIKAKLPLSLDATVFGLAIAFILFITVTYIRKSYVR